MINMSNSSASKGCIPSVYVPNERLRNTWKLPIYPCLWSTTLHQIQAHSCRSRPVPSLALRTRPPWATRSVGELGPVCHKLVQQPSSGAVGWGRWSLGRITRGRRPEDSWIGTSPEEPLLYFFQKKILYYGSHWNCIPLHGGGGSYSRVHDQSCQWISGYAHTTNLVVQYYVMWHTYRS
jgi:hypothetical protein